MSNSIPLSSIPANEGGQDLGAADADPAGTGELTALIRFRKTTPGNEPLGDFIELSVTADGFQDIGGIAGSGDKPGTIGAQRLANLLLQHYKRPELDRLLSHVVELRADLAR
jgi:hypothetical protein